MLESHSIVTINVHAIQTWLEDTLTEKKTGSSNGDCRDHQNGRRGTHKRQETLIAFACSFTPGCNASTTICKTQLQERNKERKRGKEEKRKRSATPAISDQDRLGVCARPEVNEFSKNAFIQVVIFVFPLLSVSMLKKLMQ